MNDILDEWIWKAEEDYRAVIRLSRHSQNPTHNIACFCCQQCAEKYMKALLVFHKIEFEKWHDLLYLLDLLLPVEPTLEFLRPEMKKLNRYAVDVRYPGDFADSTEAKQAMKAIKVVRSTLRERLGLRKVSRKKRTR